ncbi:hypothetical protein LCGC14_2464430, partial [marine sediment metagenome]
MAVGTEGALTEKYGSMAPEDIQAEKANIQFLILRQMDRTNWLKSISLAGKTTRNEITSLLRGLRGSIQAVELSMAPFLDTTTLEETKAIRDKLDKDHTFKDPTDKIERKTRLLYQAKYTTKGSVIQKTYTISYDTDEYMNLLDEWSLILMKNLGKANLA